MSGEPDSDEVERRIERGLEDLAAGREPELDTLALGLEAAQRARVRGELLAHAYLARLERGEADELARFEERLVDDGERRPFQDVLAARRAAGAALPGVLLPGS